MIATLKISRLAALSAAAIMMAGIALAPASHAGTPQYQTVKSPITPVAAKLKTPGKGARRDCNGQTTTQCCDGLSYCGCLYMPGSDDTHPTACFANPPPKPKG